jgi:nitrate/nitrite transport system substrate-binding protein
MSQLSRRKFIITAGATTASSLIIHGCGSGTSTNTANTPASDATPVGSTSGTGDTPETDKITLGFIALTDCAPIVIAKEKGFFEKYGMKNVEVKKQTSWATTRDNLELGGEKSGIDGAHILTPMPYLMTAGKITKSPVPMYILARLNTNGQGISIASEYADLKLEAKAAALKARVDEKKASGKKFQCAVTFPGGTHDLWMRYWLAANGINPETDVDIKVIPPPQMVANMETKSMDAFCVGEPWNQRLVTKKLGYNAVTTGELWNDHPEKAFTLRADWVDKNPKASKALLMAILDAQRWCDDDANKEEMCKILSADKYVKAPAADIIERMRGNFDLGNGRVLTQSPLLMKFWRENASFPYKSHDTWFVTEDIRWGKLDATTEVKSLVDKVNRSDLWREAATAISVAAAEIPTGDSRGVETFFDGVKFDPANTTAYLDGLKIKKA